MAIAALYSSAMAAISLIPMEQAAGASGIFFDIDPTTQNLLHIPAFFVLTIVWLQIATNYGFGNGKKFAFVFLTTLAFGAFIEAAQWFIPGRYPDIADVGFNIVGILAAMAVFLFAEKRKPGLVKKVVCG